MARAKKNIPPGRKSDFTGEKLAWLESFRDDVLNAGNAVGDEYTSITNRFLKRYGYDLPFTKNVDGDPEDNPPVISSNPSAEEKTRRDDIRAVLRTKLSGWFRTRFRNKKVHSGSIGRILTSMHKMSGVAKRPRRKNTVTVYSNLHYEKRLKNDFNQLWAEAKDANPGNSRLAMSQDFVRSRWAQESPEFKESVEKQAAEMHAAAVKEWQEKRTLPEGNGNAETFHEALETLEEVAIPMADALADRLGSHVVVLVVGPVGSQKGEVCLRTIFSDTSSCQTSKTWAEFDHSGFSAMEKSITRYGRALFSKAECRDRAWPPLAPDAEQLTSLIQMPPAPAPPSTALAPPAPVAPPRTVKAAPVVPTPVDDMPISPPPVDNSSSPEAAATTDGIDRSEWTSNFTEVYTYLASKNWGEDWKALLAALVHFEWSYYNHDDVYKIEAINSRPAEIAEWMKKHRVLDDYALKRNFGERLLEWWKEVGPRDRWDSVEGLADAPRDEKDDDWDRATRAGRNGLQLFALALAWWGQAIWNDGAANGLGGGEEAMSLALDWQRILRDLTWVLGFGSRNREEEEEAEQVEEERKAAAAAAKKGKGKKGGKGAKAPKKKAGKRKAEQEEDSAGSRKKARTENTGSGGEEPQRPKPRRLKRGYVLSIDAVKYTLTISLALPPLTSRPPPRRTSSNPLPRQTSTTPRPLPRRTSSNPRPPPHRARG
ncbi:hypothetical protein R3P38DRAFT_2581825 [Favolaschia claudopus]|uniref:Uncharacterized protein n=1 Tax=Favolaschia claudopus TaxID=2862362 RepID=A0AAV9ZBB6_9AGAR